MTPPAGAAGAAEPAGTTAGTAPPIEIRVAGVHKAFGSHLVLRGIDLAVPRGDMLAIIGGSGCGKTVLLQCIIGLLRPEAGEIGIADHERPGAPLIDIVRLGEDELDELRRHWAVVFQKNALFSGTVYENIAVWLREVQKQGEPEIRTRAVQALSSVGFKADDALLAKQRGELSGGMAKRVALARAIAMDPIVTFYDEPTTGLDPYLAQEVHDTIGRIHESPAASGVRRTTLIITHDKDLLTRLAPRVVMLEAGKVLLDGSHREFVESGLPEVGPYLSAMPSLHARAHPGD